MGRIWSEKCEGRSAEGEGASRPLRPKGGISVKKGWLLLFLLLPLALSQVAFADISLQDYQFNINGSQYCPAADLACPGDIAAISGLNAAGFNTTTGTGTLT